jgi:hypothetical protein
MQPPNGLRSFEDDSTVGRKHDEREEKNDGWKFVSSMTFASSSTVGTRAPRSRQCDCDECECRPTSRQERSKLASAGSNEDDRISLEESDESNSNKGSYIPNAILRAIEQHRKQKRLRVSLQQTRTLRARHWCEDPPPSASEDQDHEKEDAKEEVLYRDIDKGKESVRGDHPPVTPPPSAETAVSAWEWELPLGAEPKVEFGASHRVVWIRRCPGALQSIAASQGGGTAMVVGSSDEESRRVLLEDWTAGAVVFVPSNGGHAVGYAHVNPKPTSTASAASLSSFDEESSATNDRGGSNTQENEQQDKSEPKLSRAAACSPGGLYATLLVVKLPDRLLKSRQHIDPQIPSWLAPLLPICRRLVSDDERSSSNYNEGRESNARSATIGPKPRYTVLNAEDAQQIKAALSSVVEAAKEVS